MYLLMYMYMCDVCDVIVVEEYHWISYHVLFLYVSPFVCLFNLVVCVFQCSSTTIEENHLRTSPIWRQSTFFILLLLLHHHHHHHLLLLMIALVLLTLALSFLRANIMEVMVGMVVAREVLTVQAGRTLTVVV